MSKDLKNILHNLNADIDQELLLKYLQNELTKEQEHEVESALSEDEFAADAMEGLYALKNTHDLGKISENLNRSLHYKLKEKRKLKNARGNAGQPWFLYAVILILLLCIIGYLVIKKFG